MIPSGGCFASSRFRAETRVSIWEAVGCIWTLHELLVANWKVLRIHEYHNEMPKHAKGQPSNYPTRSALCVPFPLCCQGYVLVFGNTGQASEIRPLGVSPNPVAA
jgi:hypothetical protein